MASVVSALFFPSVDGGWRDMFRAGILPFSANDLNGGYQMGSLPDNSPGEFATGNIQDDNANNFGNDAAHAQAFQGFKIPEGLTNPVIWLKLFKVGVPTDNVVVSIWTDTGGNIPVAQVGAAFSINAKQITSNTNGAWYPFVVPSGLLTPNTKYHIVMGRSGAVDAATCFYHKMTTRSQYNYNSYGYGTSANVFAVSNIAYSMCFMVQNATNTSVLQPGGKFDAMFCFNDSVMVDHSRGLRSDMRYFHDSDQSTTLIRGMNFAKGKTIVDYRYGIDHERLVLTTDAVTGFPILTYYDENPGVSYQVIGTTNICDGNFYDIGVGLRTKGDGQDYVALLLNGNPNGVQVENQTFTSSLDMRDLGTASIGCGFPVAPQWKAGSITAFTALPSLLATPWTYQGTTPEASAGSVANGKYYRSIDVGTTGYGYYQINPGFVNANGWAVTMKMRSSYAQSPSTNTSLSCFVAIADGTGAVNMEISDCYLKFGNYVTPDYIYQGDFRNKENVITIHGKGANYFVEVNGKIVYYGIGKLGASASNYIQFGDSDTVSGDNTESIWSYIKFTDTYIGPNFNTGASIHEMAYATGDARAVLPYLYNAGTQISAKKYFNMQHNYVGVGYETMLEKIGIVFGLTTSSTSLTQLQDMEAYVYGSQLAILAELFTSNNTSNAITAMMLFIDGITLNGAGLPSDYSTRTSTTANQDGTLTISADRQLPYCGLHKVECRWNVNSGSVATANWRNRKLHLKTRAN